MLKKKSTQSELLRIYKEQRRKANKDFDVPMLKFYAELDKMNAKRIKQGKEPIIPIISN